MFSGNTDIYDEIKKIPFMIENGVLLNQNTVSTVGPLYLKSSTQKVFVKCFKVHCDTLNNSRIHFDNNLHVIVQRNGNLICNIMDIRVWILYVFVVRPHISPLFQILT